MKIAFILLLFMIVLSLFESRRKQRGSDRLNKKKKVYKHYSDEVKDKYLIRKRSRKLI